MTIGGDVKRSVEYLIYSLCVYIGIYTSKSYLKATGFTGQESQSINLPLTHSLNDIKSGRLTSQRFCELKFGTNVV